jgi:hypothetical protein
MSGSAEIGALRQRWCGAEDGGAVFYICRRFHSQDTLKFKLGMAISSLEPALESRLKHRIELRENSENRSRC